MACLFASGSDLPGYDSAVDLVPNPDLQSVSHHKTCGHAEEILDIANRIQHSHRLGNCLLIAGRVRLSKLVKNKGHYLVLHREILYPNQPIGSINIEQWPFH